MVSCKVDPNIYTSNQKDPKGWFRGGILRNPLGGSLNLILPSVLSVFHRIAWPNDTKWLSLRGMSKFGDTVFFVVRPAMARDWTVRCAWENPQLAVWTVLYLDSVFRLESRQQTLAESTADQDTTTKKFMCTNNWYVQCHTYCTGYRYSDHTSCLSRSCVQIAG